MKTKAWINAFRLRTLPLSFSVIIAGNALAYKPNFKFSLLFLELITTLFLQILSNLANDYGDFLKGTDNDKRIGPERALQSGKLSKKEMRNAIIIFVSLSLASGITLLFYAFNANEISTILIWLAIGLLCIVAAIKYTIGKKAYGYYAMGDLAVFLFFGVIGVFGSYYLQEHYYNKIVVAVACGYGLWCTAVLNLNNMRDVENDGKHNKKTTALLFGFEGAIFYHCVLLIIPYSIFAIFLTNPFYTTTYLLFATIPITAIQLFKIIQITQRIEFDKWLKIQAITTLLHSVLLFTYTFLIYA